MELSMTEKVLIHLLKTSKIDKDAIIGITLMLREQETMMEDMIIYLSDNPKATQADTLMKAVELTGGPKEFTIED